MANTTFTGPVRSVNGFEIISVNATTGTVTTTATFGASTSITTLTAPTIKTTTLQASDGSAAATIANTTGIVTVSGGLTMADAKNVVVGSTTGTKIGTATTQKLGFYNATPVVQQATTGTTTGFTAGSGTAANNDSTYTGGSGSKAYTVGDIVLALKNLGLLAAS